MASGRLLLGLFKTNVQKLQLGIWPWTKGLKSRLPEHFKKCFTQKFMKDPIPVHYRPDPEKYVVNAYGVVTRKQNVPIPLMHVPESDMGLWGGESFIFGYRKRKNRKLKPSVPYIWKPRLFKKTLYSEILDRWMQITVTRRTLDLIDENYGFDYYILKTDEIDLRSKLGMRLKREMLTTLAKKSMYPDNPEKRDRIYEKYKEFIIPLEEVEWLGLSLSQAERKQAKIEEKEAADNVRPLKEVYMEELIEQLKAGTFVEKREPEKSMLSSINPFK